MNSLSDQFSIPLLWRISEALGITAVYGRSQRRSNLSFIEKRKAVLKGFELLQIGEDAIFEALAQAVQTPARRSAYVLWPHFGELQDLLHRNLDYCEGLEVFRTILRSFILER